MTSYSLRYLFSRSRKIIARGKMLGLFGLVFLMLLPTSALALARSSLSEISPQATHALLPNLAGANFTMTANPASITTTSGSTTTVQITLTSTGGFSGRVYMDAFAVGSAVLNPPFVTLSNGGTATTTLTITVSSYLPPGNDYFAFVEATGGCTLFNFFKIPIIVTGPQFTVTAEKTQMTLAPGASDTSRIDLASLNGFSGIVSLSAGPLMTSFSSPTVTLAPAGTGSSILTIMAPLTTEPGDYTVFVSGYSHSGSVFLSDHTEIHVTVTGPTFDLSASKILLTLVAGGPSNSSTISVTPSGGFTGTVTLTNSTDKPLISTFSTSTIIIGPSAGSSVLTVSAPSNTKAGTYSIGITGTSGSQTRDITVDIVVKSPDFYVFANPPLLAVVVGGSSCTSTISVTGIFGFSGAVSLALKGASALTTNLNPTSVNAPGTSTLTVSAATGTTPGVYDLKVNGTSSSPALAHYADLTIIVIGPDFAVSANPDTLTVLAGGTGTSTISLTSILQFSGTVTLTSPPPLFGGPTGAFSPTSINPGQTSTLTVTVPPGTFPTNYIVTVNATSGKISHTIDVTIAVVVPGFILTASPASLTVTAGSSQTSTITVVPTNGFSGMVDLAVSPSQNLNASITPTPVASGSTATLSVNSTIPGPYTVDIIGTSTTLTGSAYNSTTVTVTVVGPDFAISASPTLLTINAGGSQPSTITITPTNGFNSPVGLSATAQSGLTLSFAPTTITLPSTTSTLTVTVDPTATPGAYTFDIHGTSGKLDRTAQLTVNVAGFILTANPTSLTIVIGGSQPSTITGTPQNGFSSTVQLSAALNTGLSGTFTPTSIPGGSGTSQFKIAASSSTLPGTYLVNVTGTSGSLTQKATITVTVPVPDFDISASPTTVSCLVLNDCPTTITITPRLGFTGTVAFTANPGPGLLCNAVASISVLTVLTATLSCHANVAGSFPVTITGTSGTISHTTTAITYNIALAPDFTIQAGSVAPSSVLAGASGKSTISVSSIGGFGGVVRFQASVSTPSGLTCTAPANVYVPGQSDLTCSAPAAGDYTVAVTGTATIGGTPVSHTTQNIVFHIADFSINAGAVSPFPVTAKSTATSTITITDLNGFSGTVAFTVSTSSPSGLTCTPPGSVSGTTLTSTLSCNSSTPGDYTVTVTGTSGSLSHPTGNIVFQVSGFTISASSPAAANTGQTVTSTITVTAVNGFTGTVSLSDPPPNGLICSAVSPASVTLGSTATATLACHSTQDGTFTVTITGTSGSLAPQTTASFTFHTPDITITSTPPASVNLNQTTTSTITVSPVYGFTGTVTLTISAPTGISCTLDHSTLQGSGTATLTCSSSTPNDYTVTVTATGGPAPRTTTQTFHVSPAPSPAAPVPSTPWLLYVIIIIVVVAVIGGIAVVVVRRNKP